MFLFLLEDVLDDPGFSMKRECLPCSCRGKAVLTELFLFIYSDDHKKESSLKKSLPGAELGESHT